MNLLNTLFSMQSQGGLLICNDGTRITVNKVTGSTFKNNNTFYVLYLDQEGVSKEIDYSTLKEARPLGIDYELPTRRDEAPEEHVEDEVPEIPVDEVPEEHVEEYTLKKSSQSVYDVMERLVKIRENGGTILLTDGRILTVGPFLTLVGSNAYFKGIYTIDGKAFDDIESDEFSYIEDEHLKEIPLLSIWEVLDNNKGNSIVTSRTNRVLDIPTPLESDSEITSSDTEFPKSIKKRKRFVVPLMDDELVDMLNTTREKNYTLLEPYYLNKQRVEITSHKIPKSAYNIIYMFKTDNEYFAIIRTDENDIFHIELSDLIVVSPISSVTSNGKYFFEQPPVHISNKEYWNIVPFEDDCYLHEKTGILLSLENDVYVFQALYDAETYTDEDWKNINKWVSDCGIRTEFNNISKSDNNLNEGNLRGKSSLEIKTEEPQLPECNKLLESHNIPEFYELKEFERLIVSYIEKCFAIVVNGETIYNTFLGCNHKERIVGNLIKHELVRDFHSTLMSEINSKDFTIDIYNNIDSPTMLRAEYFKNNNKVKITVFESIKSRGNEQSDIEAISTPRTFKFEINTIVNFIYKDEPKRVLVKVANDKYVEGICQESNTYKKYLVSFIEKPFTPIKKKFEVPMAPRKLSGKCEDNTYKNMIIVAIKELRVNGTKGVSRQAINTYLETKYNKNNNKQVVRTLRRLISEGFIVQNGQRFGLTHKGNEFIKIIKKLDFTTTEEVDKSTKENDSSVKGPTKCPIKGKLTIIDEAIKNNKILDIKYDGGSIPNIKRPIRPTRLFKSSNGETIVEAICLIEDVPRRFRLDKIKI